MSHLEAGLWILEFVWMKDELTIRLAVGLFLVPGQGASSKQGGEVMFLKLQSARDP